MQTSPSFGFWAMLGLSFCTPIRWGPAPIPAIEAVSNSMPVMREPRVQTGQQTMRLMAISLALTAGGLMIAYLLLNIQHRDGKTKR